jgi:periplasmic protein CpxP/Spy
MSKKMFLVLVCALFLVFTGAQSMAQNNPDKAASQAASSASQAQNDAGQVLDPETKAQVQSKLQEISTELNLTDDQKDKIKPVLQDEFKQLKAVKDDASLSPDQRQAKAKEIHESTKSQINSFLTPDQQKKLGEMREKAKENLDK